MQAQRLLRLEAPRIILLWDVDREEERPDAAFAGARQIPVAVRHPRAHAAAEVELAVERVHVSVEHQGAPVDGERVGGNRRCGVGRHGRPEQRPGRQRRRGRRRSPEKPASRHAGPVTSAHTASPPAAGI
jgi:hypothetical protein